MQSVTKRVNYTNFVLALLGYFLFVCQDTISKDLINRYHSTQIVLFSSFAALITVVIYTQYKHAWHKLKKASFTVHFFRTLTMFLAMSSFVYSTYYLPLTTLYSIIFTIALEANVGDIILLSRYLIHCSLPNKSKNFRISMDLRFNKTGQHSGRDPLPSFVVKSKNRKNIKVNNYKQWIAMWEEAKNKCIPRKWTYKYPLPTFKNSKRDLPNVI
jgi:cation transport ATPase